MLHPTSRRRRILTAAALMFALAAFPLGTAAIHQFTDVPDSNIYHNDIDALVDSGVTSGCGGGKYCPSAYVTREQMAAFLNRLGALAPEKTPVVNATTVDRYNASELNRVAYAVAENLVDGNATTTGDLNVSITAPGRGYLMIWGHAAIGNASGSVNDDVWCSLEVDNVEVTNTGYYQDAPYLVSSDQQACNTSGAKTVCGGTYSVDLHVADVATDTNIYDATLMVEFVPFNGTGGIPGLIICLI